MALLFNGCTGGYQVHKQNGMYYDTSRIDCTRSKLDRKTNRVKCWNKNGQYTGTLYPIHPNAVREQRRQKEEFNRSMNDLSDSIQRSNRTRAINNLAISNSLNKYGYGYGYGYRRY